MVLIAISLENLRTSFRLKGAGKNAHIENRLSKKVSSPQKFITTNWAVMNPSSTFLANVMTFDTYEYRWQRCVQANWTFQ